MSVCGAEPISLCVVPAIFCQERVGRYADIFLGLNTVVSLTARPR